MGRLKALGDTYLPGPINQEFFYKDGDTGDIATKVLSVFQQHRDQVAALAPHLKGATLLETCRNIFRIVKENIRYREDPREGQWVRRPARMWYDGVGDCKSYSVFIASCLYHLGIKGCFRFVSYTEENIPTHVYVVVMNQGREIILDAVLPGFNQEKDFKVKNDFSMTRIYELAGIGGPTPIRRYGRNQPQINGGLSTLLNKGARQRVLWDSLPGLAMLSLYQFIPGGNSGEFERIVPGIGTPDNLLQYCPEIVKQKRYTSFQSFWDFGDWAAVKVESDVFPKLRTYLAQILGVDPTEWWRRQFKANGISGIGVIDPATAGALLQKSKDVFAKVKNVIGNLFGGSDIKWKRGDPSQWGADPGDWNGFKFNPIVALPIGGGTAGGSQSWGDIFAPAPPPPPVYTGPVNQPPITQPYDPNIMNPPITQMGGGDSNIILIGIAAAVVLGVVATKGGKKKK